MRATSHPVTVRIGTNQIHRPRPAGATTPSRDCSTLDKGGIADTVSSCKVEMNGGSVSPGGIQLRTSDARRIINTSHGTKRIPITAFAITHGRQLRQWRAEAPEAERAGRAR